MSQIVEVQCTKCGETYCCFVEEIKMDCSECEFDFCIIKDTVHPKIVHGFCEECN